MEALREQSWPSQGAAAAVEAIPNGRPLFSPTPTSPGSGPYFAVTYLTCIWSILPLNLNGALSE